MPIKRIAWACKWGCGKGVLTSKSAMKKHEERCLYNPVRRACITCANLGTDYETIYNPYHGGNPGSTDTEVRYNFCKADDDIDLSEKLICDCEKHLDTAPAKE